MGNNNNFLSKETFEREARKRIHYKYDAFLTYPILKTFTFVNGYTAACKLLFTNPFTISYNIHSGLWHFKPMSQDIFDALDDRGIGVPMPL